jgi:hypothetical protein
MARSPAGDPNVSESPPRAPRWVRVSAVVLVIIIVLIAAVALFGGGEHGPGRHTSRDDGGGTPASVVDRSGPAQDGAGAHPQPEGGGH